MWAVAAFTRWPTPPRVRCAPISALSARYSSPPIETAPVMWQPARLTQSWRTNVSISLGKNPISANRTGQVRAARSAPLVFHATGGSHFACARVQLVRSFTARFVGMIGRRSLDDHDGLLLAPCRSVHTLGLRFAIDIVFLDAGLKVLEVTSHVRPWRFVCAPRRACYVLGLRAGLADAIGLRTGQSATLRSERRATC